MLTKSQLNDRLPRTVDAQRTPDDARNPETVAMWYSRCFGEAQPERKEMNNIKTPHDLTGKRFGRLTVISRCDDKSGKISWLCKCDCGNVKNISAGHLTSGDIKSCGCLFKELNHKTAVKHGMTEDPLYHRFTAMISRCECKTDNSYKYYGARGITVCDEWRHDFKAFYDWSMKNGYAPNLSIDRIDNNKGYSPDNCRWTTNSVQQNNKRTNVFIEYKGKRQTLTQWSRELKISYKTLKKRLVENEWSMEKVLA